jgi:adenosine deaminase
VTLEVAITSNVQTGAAPGRASHQLATLVAAGVRVALCTDNPVVSDTRLTREYELAGGLVDAASLDVIRQNAVAARFTSAGGVLPRPPGRDDRSYDGAHAGLRTPESK